MENLFKGIHLYLDSKGRLGIPITYRDHIMGLLKGSMVITIDTEESVYFSILQAFGLKFKIKSVSYLLLIKMHAEFKDF